MAKHSGRNGKAKLGATFIGNLTNWEVTETAEEIDLTDADDAWKDSGDGPKAWSWSVTVRMNHDAAANQTPRAGDVLALEFYSEGDAAGKKYMSGNGYVTEVGNAVPHDGATERTYSGTGRGALSEATVA